MDTCLMIFQADSLDNLEYKINAYARLEKLKVKSASLVVNFQASYAYMSAVVFEDKEETK